MWITLRLPVIILRTPARGGLGGGSASITSSSENSFWENLEDSIGVILDVDIELDDSEEAAVAGVVDNDLAEEANESEARFSTENEFDFNPDTGILIVFAPDRLQKEVEQYLNEAVAIASRQVLLEATVVEVVLNNEYRQGIDWSAFNQFARDGLALYQGAAVGGPAAFINELIEEFEVENTTYFPISTDADGIQNEGGLFADQAYQDFITPADVGVRAGENITEFTSDVEEVTDSDNNVLGYNVTREYSISRPNNAANKLRAGGLAPAISGIPGAAFTAAYRSEDFSAAVELLDTFGDAKVLSSPRISVLHNQPALLRVVDQEVYFSIDVDEAVNEETGQVTSRSYDVSENTVDVGFAMNVLPHVTDGDEIFLNLKPSVTRVLDYRAGAHPGLRWRCLGIGGQPGADYPDSRT